MSNVEVKPGERFSQLPEFCFVFAPDAEPGNYVRAVQRGERGYSGTSYDVLDPDKAKALVTHLNRRLGVSDLQVACMEAGSLFGFDVPAANPRLVGDNPWRSEGSPERCFLDDGSWFVEAGANETRQTEGGYLYRRGALSDGAPQSIVPVGGFQRRHDGKWEADLAQEWDADTQTDALHLGTLDTRNEAIQALWEGRDKAFGRGAGVTIFGMQHAWSRARGVAAQKGEIVVGSMCEGREFCGTVLHADSMYVVQGTGRGAVIHAAQALSRTPEVGEIMTVKYNEHGHAIVQERAAASLER